MRYTGPKMKLCRREQKNLFWPTKYNIDKNTSLPGKSGRAMVRLSEYGKLLRNKQVLKRMYQMSEKQFSRMEIVVGDKQSEVIDSTERVLMIWNWCIKILY